MQLTGVHGGRRGAQRQRHRVRSGGARGGVDGRPQVERRLDVPQLLGGRADPLGVVGGLQEAASASGRSWLSR